MKSQQALNFLLGIYIFIFFTYLFGPLVIMSITAFNSAEFPSVTPWECFSFRWFNEGKIAYDGQHLAGLATDWRLHEGLITSLKIGLGVVLLSVPIGMSAAIVLTQVQSTSYSILFRIHNASIISRRYYWNFNSSSLGSYSHHGWRRAYQSARKKWYFPDHISTNLLYLNLLFFNFCSEITKV